jgi:hypothetical protein
MTQPTSYSAAGADLSFWRVPGIFLRDTLVNTLMFLTLAATAFLIDWAVRWMEGWGLAAFPSILLEGTSYALLVLGVITFVGIQIRIVYNTLKEAYRA